MLNSLKDPTRCRNHSRATKIGARMWKRNELCSNGRAVTLAHEEADEALVRLVHLLLAAREADASSVDDREVVGHGIVESYEAVIEDLDLVVG